MAELTLDVLERGLAGDAAAIRTRVSLQPAGGQGEKIFPPTYGVADNAATKYATEVRRVDGAEIDCVLLDSVASQANRMELALLDAVEAGELTIPLTGVVFNDEEGLEDLGTITALQAPHRIYDALLRDSTIDGVLFRLSEEGRAVTSASPRDASALYRYCPTALVFGAWDSTGPRGGKGSKFERALTSEIVGFDVSLGVKVSSRIDPAGIELRAARDAYEAQDPNSMWTLSVEEAATESKTKKPIAVRPSEINHGNVTPSIDARSGGVTIDRAEQLTVLSLAALRNLRFKSDGTGSQLGDAAPAAEQAARVCLAALALCATTLAYDADYDLRSRCVLVPDSPLTFEVLRRGGAEPDMFTLDRSSAVGLVKQAAEAAEQAGLGWEGTPVDLTPTDRLVTLIQRSRLVTDDDED